jgi:hypothetical protein
LDWTDVRPLIEAAFAELSDVEVSLYSPQGAPAAKAMPVNTAKPKMTASRALFIKLMHQYGTLSYRRTLLEIQKLGYFLQESGEPLRLRFEAGIYGPYASNLNKVLELLEGHYIRGYGDSQKPDTEVELLPGAVEDADNFLTSHSDSVTRLLRVAELIEGFETPYGMELLSTVHWVCTHGETKAIDAEAAIRSVQSWNDRKREMFRCEHIRLAHRRLSELAWLSA